MDGVSGASDIQAVWMIRFGHCVLGRGIDRHLELHSVNINPQMILYDL
jgi:hypothetical protein